MYKSKLQELCHKCSWNLPVYTTVREGPDHCPAFTTTVTVNQLQFSTPKNGSKSSKEAQNAAAKLAFDHFSSLPADNRHRPLNPPSPPSPSIPSPPNTASCSKDVTGAPKDVTGAPNYEILHQYHGGSIQVIPANNTSLHHNYYTSSNKVITEPVKDEVLVQNHGLSIQGSMPKDLLHLYKNQLQHYAQKNNRSLPAYSHEFVGPPHVRRFKASVMVDGKTYQSPEYYSTLKDAEHAAARAALEALSIAEVPENEGLSKTLLQELAQKMGFRFPSYSTVRSGLSHMPTFLTTVEVGGNIYEGVGCKTKKQSEMSAAKVAYEKLTNGNTVSNRTPISALRNNVEGSSHGSVPASGSDSQIIGASLTPENHTPVERSDGEINTHPRILSYSPHLSSNSLQSTLPKLADTVRKANLGEEVEVGDGKAKRHKPSSSENITHHLPEACSPSSGIDTCSVPSELHAEARQNGGCDIQNSKILIIQRGSCMEIPEGSIILPHQDDTWVAIRVPLNQNQEV